MEEFWKAAGGVMVALVLALTLGKREKDLAMVLTMAVCCMTALAAVSRLMPVFDFLYSLEELGDLPGGMLGILMKIVGIGIVTETAGLICQDGGNSSMAKGLQLLGSAVILYLSIPVMESMLELIRGILGEL